MSTLNQKVIAFDKKNLSHPTSMKLDHANHVIKGLKTLIEKKDLLMLSGTSMRAFLPDSSSIINAIQMTDFAKYMPIGPHYNEGERKWALSVVNSLAPQSLEFCWAEVS